MDFELETSQGSPPSIEAAVEAFFADFDFGKGGDRTRLSYRSGARAFMRFIDEGKTLKLHVSPGCGWLVMRAIRPAHAMMEFTQSWSGIGES